jgi:hypothetical protein
MSLSAVIHLLAAVPAGLPRAGGSVSATARKLSDRMHAAADGRARARGWEVTETRGWLGLSGRSYHDPRFAARQQAIQDTPARRKTA